MKLKNILEEHSELDTQGNLTLENSGIIFNPHACPHLLRQQTDPPTLSTFWPLT